jgi:hypothetical protein
MIESYKAVCLKTYPDETDMQDYCDGKIWNPCDVRIYLKGETYLVQANANTQYFKILEYK